MLRPRVEAARAAPAHGLLGQLAHHRDSTGEALGVDAIVEHLLLLFWAGYDTTASAVSWVLHELAHRRDWQDRLRAELGDRLGADVANPDRTRALEQVSWFFNEVERMYPSALFFPRIPLQDFAFDGYVIPRGVLVFYSPYLGHRDPASWEYPNTFDPERWSPARGEQRAVAGKLVGFGGGPRVCSANPSRASSSRSCFTRSCRVTASNTTLAPLCASALSRFTIRRGRASSSRLFDPPGTKRSCEPASANR